VKEREHTDSASAGARYLRTIVSVGIFLGTAQRPIPPVTDPTIFVGQQSDGFPGVQRSHKNDFLAVSILCPRFGASKLGGSHGCPGARAPLGPIIMTGLYSVQSIVPTIVVGDLS